MKILDVIRRPKCCPPCGGEICDFYATKSSFVLLSREIALPLPQNSVATGVVYERTLSKKVLLKLIIYKQYFMNKHLPNSLRALFLSLAVLLSLPVLAVEVEIDGINYELVAKAKQATVIAKSSGKYSGEVVIPESVEHEGAAYSVTSIGDNAFSGCSGLTSVTIGSGVERIGTEAFSDCPELLDVYCYAEKVPSTKSNAFDDSYPEYATLHVPDASIDSYKATAPWSSFGKIVGLSADEPEQPEVEKCATPVVTYAEGKLSFSCDTEGANYVTKLVAEDAKEYYDAEIELSATYNIEVFATKANCENSDTVNVALVWVENGDVNEDTGVISVPAAPVLVQGNGGVLSVSGVAKGTDVVVYTISGTEVTRSTATNGTATISTGLQSGTIVVVKFGNKSVKLKI